MREIRARCLALPYRTTFRFRGGGCCPAAVRQLPEGSRGVPGRRWRIRAADRRGPLSVAQQAHRATHCRAVESYLILPDGGPGRKNHRVNRCAWRNSCSSFCTRSSMVIAEMGRLSSLDRGLHAWPCREACRKSGCTRSKNSLRWSEDGTARAFQNRNWLVASSILAPRPSGI